MDDLVAPMSAMAMQARPKQEKSRKPEFYCSPVNSKELQLSKLKSIGCNSQ